MAVSKRTEKVLWIIGTTSRAVEPEFKLQPEVFRLQRLHFLARAPTSGIF